MNNNIQYIKVNEIPAFVVIPYAEYEEMQRKIAVADSKDNDVKFPLAVAEMNALKGYSLIKSWRIFKGKTQKEMAEAMGITQGAFSQIEKSAHNQAETLRKISKILDVSPEQLTMD